MNAIDCTVARRQEGGPLKSLCFGRTEGFLKAGASGERAMHGAKTARYDAPGYR